MSQISFMDGSMEGSGPARGVAPLKTQLLKWVGNKQRFAHEIIGFFPSRMERYLEPFVGSAAVLGTLAPKRAVAGDVLTPLIDLWKAVAADPEQVDRWYAARWRRAQREGKVAAYEAVKADYNANPNPADFLFISRACYGGVLRFRQQDGGISTPCGAHAPISPASFRRRLEIWHNRVKETSFVLSDFEPLMDEARKGDVVYCDPPYTHSQTILYGAQSFDLSRLLGCIERCKARGVYVALSIDGSKRSGALLCDVPIPKGLFAREITVNVGRSMLRRFQMKGESLEAEHVRDRLLVTY